jgi:3-hydroxybutyryl-CoA dehydratase
VNFSAPFEQLATGDGFVSRGRTVTEADVVAFAALTGDWHPQHADACWAKGSVFGERIAHGMLIVSFAVGLVPFEPDRVVALRRIGDAVFKRPVRFGDTIHIEGSVAELRELDAGSGLVGWAWKVVNQDGQLVCRARVDVIWRRGEIASDDPYTPTGDGFVPIPL